MAADAFSAACIRDYYAVKLISRKHFNPRRGGNPARAVLRAQNEKLYPAGELKRKRYGRKNALPRLCNDVVT